MTDPVSSSPLRSLQQVVAPPRSAEDEAKRRQRVVQRIAALQTQLAPATQASPAASRFFSEQFKVARRVSYVGGALALAALMLLFVTFKGSSAPNLQLTSGVVFVESSGGRLALSGAQQIELGAGDALITESDAAQLHLPSQAALAMGPRSAVRLQGAAGGQKSNGDQLRLDRGVVNLSVPKLAPGQQLSVATGDALVEVHGTQFSVEVVERAGFAPSTRVSVSEGVVSVTRGTERVVLSAGQSWSSTAAPGAPPAATGEGVDSGAAAVASSVPSGASGAGSTAAPSAPGRASELAEQNRLFLSARQARNSGNTALALQQLTTLMQRHPGSELAHNARVEHFRILKAAGRLSEARASAQRYLRQYPQGFARAEAAKLSTP